MHIHTTASDGTWTPEILVKNILSAGIQVFSVTDHDSFDNLSSVSHFARKAGIFFIPGVEVSTSFCNENYHILGYGIDTKSVELQEIVAENKASVEYGDMESIKYLIKKGYPVTLKGYQEYTHNPERGGFKALNYFIDKGLCKNIMGYLSLFEDIDYPFDVFYKNYVSTELAINSIINSGGIPILAHPGGNIYKNDYKDIIELIFKKGIKGIECFHPENNTETINYCIDFCNRNKLYITGGSDCHGDLVKTRSLGKPELLIDQIQIGQLYNRYLQF
jgi:predicted metal-dependent phosphoesterase TrpH